MLSKKTYWEALVVQFRAPRYLIAIFSIMLNQEVNPPWVRVRFVSQQQRFEWLAIHVRGGFLPSKINEGWGKVNVQYYFLLQQYKGSVHNTWRHTMICSYHQKWWRQKNRDFHKHSVRTCEPAIRYLPFLSCLYARTSHHEWHSDVKVIQLSLVIRQWELTCESSPPHLNFLPQITMQVASVC